MPCYSHHVVLMNRCNARLWTHQHQFGVAGSWIDDGRDLDAQNTVDSAVDSTVDSAGDSAVDSIVSSPVDSVFNTCN